jgi:sec-independent protein translocase protein TatC
MIVFGIAFLIPLIVLMLNIVGVVKAKHLTKYRSYVIFGCFVFGAMATPSTDPFSMLALAADGDLVRRGGGHRASRRRAHKVARRAGRDWRHRR